MTAKSDRNAKIVAAFLAGAAVCDIAREFSIGMQRVYTICKDAGATRINPVTKRLAARNAEICRRLDKGETYAAVAADYNLSQPAVFFIGNPQSRPQRREVDSRPRLAIGLPHKPSTSRYELSTNQKIPGRD
jgi:Mor family transcriptional regulator